LQYWGRSNTHQHWFAIGLQFGQKFFNVAFCSYLHLQYFNWASVPGGRFSNPPTSQSPIVGGNKFGHPTKFKLKTLMRKIILIITIPFCLESFGQNLISNRPQIEKAKNELKVTLKSFSNCIIKSDTKTCIESLIKNANNEYKKYLIGGMLYGIDTFQSFKLHKEAYLSNPLEQNFILEYAIELHRKGQYFDASKLYESYLIKVKDDYRIYVWLADCYMNIGETKKSIVSWTKAEHSKNHTSIDFAIHTIYGKTNQTTERNEYRNDVTQGKLNSFLPLIFLDENWQFDWWNSETRSVFLKEDLQLAKIKLGITNKDFKLLQTYASIKELEKLPAKSNSIQKLLSENKIILNTYPLPSFGRITSDILRICFANQILSESDFYKTRGEELLNLAKQTKDKELLNIYAYLQASVNGKVEPEIDKLGWKDFKDERFAISYFIGKAAKNRFDDTELAQALIDFPNSSKLYWVKTNCAKIENKELKPILIELIKKEFKTLGSDPSHFSDPLNSYFGYLLSE
jgi:hypothetical protein